MKTFGVLIKSDNALRAEKEGRHNATSAARITKLPVAFIKQCCQFAKTETHHVSKFANDVDYFSVEAIEAWRRSETGVEFETSFRFFDDSGCEQWRTVEHKIEYPKQLFAEALAEFKAAQKEQSSAIQIFEDQTVIWLEWGGSARHPKAKQIKVAGCRVQVKRQTASITLPDGKTFTKRLKTNGFAFGVEFKVPSKSGGKDHVVIRGEHTRWCDCLGFRERGYCSHT